MRLGFVGPSYTARSSAIADEECINLFAETLQSQATVSPKKAYGGSGAAANLNYFGTPGLLTFATLSGVPRGSRWTGSQLFVVAGTALLEVAADGTQTNRGTVVSDGNAVSMAFSSVQVSIVSGGHLYCYTIATQTLVDVTPQLAGVPQLVWYSDTYFIVSFTANSTNKYQISNLEDGATYPPIQVNAVSVFPENVVSIIVNHRELWVFGSRHAQPYQDTGSNEVFDVIPGALIEKGCCSAFAPVLIDNSVFWIDENRGAWRSNGYTPQRVSTPAVEFDLSSYSLTQIAGLVSYEYQDSGHLFWIIYIPGAQWSWCYDVAESLWHKRASWTNGAWGPHFSWNHVFAFGKHIVGDWNSNNLYQLDMGTYTDNGATLRRYRRTPTVSDEMERIFHAELTIDFETGVGPQPPLVDGNNNAREPEAVLRWSDDRGKTWSNEHKRGLGMAGNFTKRVIWRRLGQSRYRVYELSVTDPVKVSVVDAYLKVAGQ